MNHKPVAEFLQKFGPDKLPVIMVDDFIVITGRYPSNEEFTSWLELSPELLKVSSCCEDSSCCCGDEDDASSCCCGSEDTVGGNCCGETSAPEKNSGDCCCSSGCC